MVYATHEAAQWMDCGGAAERERHSDLSKYCFNYVVVENRAWSRGLGWQARFPSSFPSLPVCLCCLHLFVLLCFRLTVSTLYLVSDMHLTQTWSYTCWSQSWGRLILFIRMREVCWLFHSVQFMYSYKTRIVSEFSRGILLPSDRDEFPYLLLS